MNPMNPNNPLSQFVSQSSQDFLVSRRPSWTGVAVKNLYVAPTEPSYGHYYRVSYSYRDPNTGQWWINWDWNADYLGPTPPPTGERIYKFNGTTWDMPALARTSFPYITASVYTVIAVVVLAIFGEQWSRGAMGGYPGIVGLVGFIWLSGILWSWFYQTEPVRGTKVAAAYMAWSAARRATRKPDWNAPNYDDSNPTPWINERRMAQRHEPPDYGFGSTVNARQYAQQHPEWRMERTPGWHYTPDGKMYWINGDGTPA